MVEEEGLAEDRAQDRDGGLDEERDPAGQGESSGVKEPVWRQGYAGEGVLVREGARGRVPM